LDQPDQCPAHRVVEVVVVEAGTSSSGNLAMFAAIRRASSGVTKVTAQVRTAK